MGEERKAKGNKLRIFQNEANYFVYEFVCLKQKKNALGKGL